MIRVKLFCFIYLVFIVTQAFAVDVEGPCTRNIKIPRHALYKSENVHGGRGPSLITSYGNTRQWPPCGKLKIYNMGGDTIGSFGCYDPGHLPYGRRFYTGVPGGSYSSATTLFTRARRASSKKIVIDVSNRQNKALCWVVKDPRQREGGL